MVAKQGDQVLGAVWVRIMKDYGHVDDETPSLSLSVLPEFWNCGIGTALLRSILKDLEQRSYKQVSLSVQKENYAFNLYKKMGFEVYLERETDVVMVHRFSV